MKVVVIQQFHNMDEDNVKQFIAELIMGGMPSEMAADLIKNKMVQTVNKEAGSDLEMQTSWQIMQDDIPRMKPQKSKLILAPGDVPHGTKES